MTRFSRISIDRTDRDGEPDINGEAHIAFYDQDGLLCACVYVQPDGTIYAHAIEGSKISYRAKCAPDQTSEEL